MLRLLHRHQRSAGRWGEASLIAAWTAPWEGERLYLSGVRPIVPQGGRQRPASRPQGLGTVPPSSASDDRDQASVPCPRSAGGGIDRPLPSSTNTPQLA